jgi:hypothetical protein
VLDSDGRFIECEVVTKEESSRTDGEPVCEFYVWCESEVAGTLLMETRSERSSQVARALWGS